jgi:hypothetical protein
MASRGARRSKPASLTSKKAAPLLLSPAHPLVEGEGCPGGLQPHGIEGDRQEPFLMLVEEVAGRRVPRSACPLQDGGALSRLEVHGIDLGAVVVAGTGEVAHREQHGLAVGEHLRPAVAALVKAGFQLGDGNGAPPVAGMRINPPLYRGE